MKNINLLRIISLAILLIVVTNSCGGNGKSLEDRDIILPDNFQLNGGHSLLNSYKADGSNYKSEKSDYIIGIDDNERKNLRIDDLKNPGLHFDDGTSTEFVSGAYDSIKGVDNKSIVVGEILDETAKGRIQIVYIHIHGWAAFLVSYDSNGNYIDSHLVGQTDTVYSATTAEYNLIYLYFIDGGESWGDYIQLNKDLKFVKANFDNIDRTKINFAP